MTPSLGRAPHLSHRTCHAPCRLRRQAGAAARFLRRVPPKGDGQTSGARGGGRQHLQWCSLRPRVRCAGQGEGGGGGLLVGGARPLQRWSGWVLEAVILRLQFLCAWCRTGGSPRCSAAPAALRSSRRASGAPRWRRCCAACCTCRPPRPTRRAWCSARYAPGWGGDNEEQCSLQVFVRRRSALGSQALGSLLCPCPPLPRSSRMPSSWWPWHCRPTASSLCSCWAAGRR